MVLSKNNTFHYIWGENCDGWKFWDHQNLSIILEKMPPGTKERLHYHQKSFQLFFMLKGTATLKVNEQLFHIYPNEAKEILPFAHHQILNETKDDIEFLVISSPNTLGDRMNL
ncbi:cupin domain-containing protein [Neobacillus niacini]|uniref:cupin domain-containing protein n=1 Tax=Neobacillus niacini TaxID=86668 RepID=UPI0021CB76AE|nr:cupin domain-containing protein [Neobacillus niacini]MCM3766339.1 cupin domain-containing protein [Neobacillus niacini]